jgi:hypothetical protein
MSVPQAFVSQISTWISSLDQKVTLECANTLVTCAEAGFCSQLKRGNQHNTNQLSGRLMAWLQETSIARYNTIQAIFNAATLPLVSYNLVRISNEIENKLFLNVVDLTFTQHLMVQLPVCFALFTISALAYLIIFRKTLSLDERDEVGKFKIMTSSNSFHLGAGIQHIFLIVTNCAQALFSSNRILMMVSLASSGYVLLKNMNIKWISFSRICSYNLRSPPVSEVTLAYTMIILPKHKSVEKEKCSKCLVNRTDMVFCAYHPLCKSCVTDTVIKKSIKLETSYPLKKVEKNKYIWGPNSFIYKAFIPQQTLPSCPSCGTVPKGNFYSMQVKDRIHGDFNANIIIEAPPLNNNSLYNSVQTGLG